MDRTVRIQFYSVTNLKGDKSSFSECLEYLHKLPLLDREAEADEGVLVRLERHSSDGDIICVEFVRLQHANLPPKALAGKPIEKLGVPRIGHPSAFRYDKKRSVLAFEAARNGITPARIGLYISALIRKVPGFSILPVLSSDAWDKLKRGRVREISVAVGAPDNLSAVTAPQTMVKTGLESMKKGAKTPVVKAGFSMGFEREDIPNSRAQAMLRWFIGQRSDNNDAEIKKISAKVVLEQEQKTEILSFIKAHLADSKTLELPDDDPDVSYQKRDLYIKGLFTANKTQLDAQF